MKTAMYAAALLALTACAGKPHFAAEPVSVTAEAAPVFMQYRAGQAGPVKLDAPSAGVLIQRGRCLGIVRDDGRFATLVWPATARMERDSRGLVVVDGEGAGRVRLGERVVFTGGPLPRGTAYPFGDDVHTADMPMECAHYPGYDGWIAIVNPGFRTR
jgi:hypothetical protein